MQPLLHFLLIKDNQLVKFFSLTIILLFFLSYFCGNSIASISVYKIDSKASKIGGSIKYALIGNYICVFEKYYGVLKFDPDNLAKSQIYLEIVSSSVKSSHPKLDKIAISPRLLDSQNFPKILFESLNIRKTNIKNEYLVKGKFKMHGVEQTIEFPFTIILTKSTGQVKARGNCPIKRKEYGILWHNVLDKGGIIVGDYLNVEWNITAAKIH